MSAVFKASFALVVLLAGSSLLYGQSTDQNYPTPITSTELNVLIKARDVGDARLTTYFYAFDGAQGDIFVNVVASNFSGDIDVFTADGLQPLTKIVLYADAGSTETGRLIYLRKPERLLMRVQGRPPADDPATFKIRFGGSFIALAPPKKGDLPPRLPEVTAKKDESGVIVNSVGTIVGTVPKTKPVKEKTETAAEDTSAISSRATPPVEKKDNVAERKETNPPPKGNKGRTKSAADESSEVSTIFGSKSTKTAINPSPKSTPPSRSTPPRTSPPAGDRTGSTITGSTTTDKSAANPPARSTTTKSAPPPKEKVPDPIASIHLVVETKAGEIIDRPMSEVSQFGVLRGVLTVVMKDGKIFRYSVLDLSKITVQ